MGNMEVAIVDYEMGNIKSVSNAFSYLGCDVVVTQKAERLKTADAVVLPGVGAFGKAMQNLSDLNLKDEIILLAQDQKMTLLGICLGMQLLADSSDEGGRTTGLSLVPGTVVKFDSDDKIRFPHVGWNSVQLAKEQDSLNWCENGDSFYFVHGFVFVCDNDDHVVARTTYGQTFASVINKQNVFGVQFHPERSQTKGLALLRCFLREASHLNSRANSC